ncbi:MAG: DUF935 domain-containing protein [Betaproteobacteria bacterium]|nr:DUF935 domain-containing protein [Betaproteobacteria bacterium]
MTKILDQFGAPINTGRLKEPQTAGIAQLSQRLLEPMLNGLTPARLSAALVAADNGDLIAQHRIFSDMEERDAHLSCELNKRRQALLNLDWDIVPPRNASSSEKKAAAWVQEVLEDAADPFSDLLLALMDAVGHGFSAVEIAWRREGSEWLPEFFPRPQEWFRLDKTRTELRLVDHSLEGLQLAPFGWVWHSHGKAKTGYMGRMGLHRVISWPFIYKAYAIGDFAEFLETFGLPIIVGKYPQGATTEEKRSLFSAVAALGHDARAIMPAEMQLEIQKTAGAGDSSPHLAMVDWAERSISKAILGQTVSAEAKSTGLGSGVANLHAEVRNDILRADARQIAGTVSRDLVYPLLALNLGGIDGLRRCPRLVFDTGDAEDLKSWSEALPALVSVGCQIPSEWVNEKLKIPQPQQGEAVLSPPAIGFSQAALSATTPPLRGTPPRRGISAARGLEGLAALEDTAAPEWDAMLKGIEAEIESAPDLETLQARLVEKFGALDSDRLVHLMSAAFALAELKGISDVLDGR